MYNIIMNQEKLKKLLDNILKSDENEVIEFKENNFNKEEIGKRISALSNSANLVGAKKAYLVFGVSDYKNIVGTKFLPKKEKIGNEVLESWLNNMLSPKTDFNIYEFIYSGKGIVVFEISPAIHQPIKFQNISYVRISSTTRKLSEYSEKERKIWQNIDKKSFGSGIARENLGVSEILELLDFSKFFSLIKQKAPTKTIGYVERMIEYGFVKKNFDNDYDITNLGAILLAKDLSNFSYLKNKAPRVTIWKGNSKLEIDKKQDGSKGYAIAFEGLIEFVNDKLPSNEEITKTFREEKKMYPEIAIREFIANALIHQDFSIEGASPMIDIFDDRIEITNPGKPLIEIDRFIDHTAISRNSDIANFMRKIGFCEELGSGIDRAIMYIELYQLPAPKFEKEEKYTRVVIYAHKKLNEMTSDDRTRACYQHSVLKWVEGKRITNETLRTRFGIEKQNHSIASRIIKEAIRSGKIKESEKVREYIPFWA